MTRSPLAYPLNRGVDGDAGGAADLQTDIMRFMAILALCLVAIFALVQSIPLVPEPQPSQPPVEVPVVEPAPPKPSTPAEPEKVVLTRPKWQPGPVVRPVPEPRVETESPPSPAPTPVAATATPVEQGFTLRFESDLALTRLVAANQVGFYAISGGRTRRMAVSESRISFWDASSPNSFHEMEAATVPAVVVDALVRNGVDASTVDWGVTLPGKLSRQLDTLIREHSGGALVIGVDGELRLDSP